MRKFDVPENTNTENSESESKGAYAGFWGISETFIKVQIKRLKKDNEWNKEAYIKGFEIGSKDRIRLFIDEWEDEAEGNS